MDYTEYLDGLSHTGFWELLYTLMGWILAVMHLGVSYAHNLLTLNTDGRFVLNEKNYPPQMGHSDFGHRKWII